MPVYPPSFYTPIQGMAGLKATPSLGFADSTFEARSKSLVELANKLRECGAQEHIEVPMAVVCGDQSTGKSSVIQRICGIDLPRSNGTCTRCPMEVRLLTSTYPAVPSASSNGTASNGSSWSCSVKISWTHNSDHSLAKVPREESFGPELHNKSDVERLVRAAQSAVLNPNTPSAHFLHDNSAYGGANSTMKFTKNRVIVEVRGAPVNLTLVDLPGIIRSTERDEDKVYISLISELVLEYMRKPSNIIVLVVSATSDLENQEVYSLAKRYDPEQKRTVGVLTKPDLIEPGCHQMWLDVYHSKRYPLELGWHAVMSPSKKDLDELVTHEAALEKERQFFATSAPWDRLPAQGISLLMQSMSVLLTSVIEKRLPQMKSTVEQLYKASYEELEKQPQALPEEDRFSCLLDLLDIFGKDFGHITSELDDREFGQELSTFFHTFRNDILVTSPQFELRPAEGAGMGSGQRDEVPSPGLPSEAHRKALIAEYSEDTDMLKVTSGVAGTGSSAYMKTLQEIQKNLVKHGAGCLLDSRPLTAYTDTIKFFQSGWTEPAHKCLKEVTAKLKGISNEKVHNNFGNFPKLEGFMKYTLGRLIDGYTLHAKQQLNDLLDMEDSAPFTLNDKQFFEARTAYEAGLTTALAQAEGSRMAPSSNKDTSHTEEAVKLMASTLAYFQISSKRFRDNVPMAIKLHLLHRLGCALKKDLREQLKDLSPYMGPLSSDGTPNSSKLLGVDPRVLGMMDEDAAIKERREMLQAHLAKLDNIRKVLAQH